MQGAKTNDFLIRDCGLFDDKLKSPGNLDEAIVAVGYIINTEDEELFQEWSEAEFVARTHHNLGQLLRNNWGLWDEKSKLAKWFKAIGIWHADDMSGIILTSYYRNKHHLLIKLEQQVQNYINYWKAEGEFYG